MRAAVCAAFLAFACGANVRYAPRVRWTLLAPLPEHASLDAHSVSLPVGASIAARPVVIGSGGEEQSCDVTLTSEDDRVLSVEQADRGSYSMTGKAAGDTTLIVRCIGEQIELLARVD